MATLEVLIATSSPSRTVAEFSPLSETGFRCYRLPNRLAFDVAREWIGLSPRRTSRAAARESWAVLAVDCVIVRTSFACRAMA